VPYFGVLLPYAVAIKSIENYYEKRCSGWASKILVKLTLGGQGAPQSSFAKDSRCHNYKAFFFVDHIFTSFSSLFGNGPNTLELQALVT